MQKIKIISIKKARAHQAKKQSGEIVAFEELSL